MPNDKELDDIKVFRNSHYPSKSALENMIVCCYPDGIEFLALRHDEDSTTNRAKGRIYLDLKGEMDLLEMLLNHLRKELK